MSTKKGEEKSCENCDCSDYMDCIDCIYRPPAIYDHWKPRPEVVRTVPCDAVHDMTHSGEADRDG